MRFKVILEDGIITGNRLIRLNSLNKKGIIESLSY